MEIFDFDDYKLFVRKKLSLMPKKGHGQFRQMALHLGQNSVVISQIFKGTRDLNMEQALEISEFFGFSQLEQEYFLLMVQYARSGTQKLRDVILKSMNITKLKSKNLNDRIVQDKHLTEEAKSTFYSSWVYSGARMASGLNGGQNIDEISDNLNISKSKLTQVLEFLIENGLVVKTEDTYNVGPSITHLDKSSPLTASHLQNWRIKAFENMYEVKPEELYYTSPMLIGTEDFIKIRKLLVQTVEKTMKVVAPSPCEELACLNIDWFKFLKK